MFSYNQTSSNRVELLITGVIGKDFANDGVTSASVRAALKQVPNAETIDVLVDSPGGSFFEGLSIYQLLSAHPGRVNCTIGACAASAATLIAMAGDTIIMHETSSFLVHAVWTVAMGNADELRKIAADLALLSEAAVKAYSSRTKMSADDVRALMAEDRYMNAEEAKRLGFCTRIIEAKGSALAESHVRSEIARMRAHAEARANGSSHQNSAASKTEKWENFTYWELHEIKLENEERFDRLLADFHARTGVVSNG